MNSRFSLALVLAAALLGPLAAGADPLSVFQPNASRSISVTPADAQVLRGLPPLDAFGTVTGTAGPVVERVQSLPLAAKSAGFALRLPAHVPASFASTVNYSVSRAVRTSFTFSAAKAAEWAQAHQVPLDTLPSGLDGTTYTATLDPFALVTYGVSPSGRYAGSGIRRGAFVAVLQAPVPKIATTGVSLQVFEDWFTAQPGVPPKLAAQVRAIGDPTQTLPIPVRFDRQTATSVQVDGVKGLAIGDETGIGSAIVWTKGGKLYAVGGTLTQSDALAIANDLRRAK